MIIKVVKKAKSDPSSLSLSRVISSIVDDMTCQFQSAWHREETSRSKRTANGNPMSVRAQVSLIELEKSKRRFAAVDCLRAWANVDRPPWMDREKKKKEKKILRNELINARWMASDISWSLSTISSSGMKICETHTCPLCFSKRRRFVDRAAAKAQASRVCILSRRVLC